MTRAFRWWRQDHKLKVTFIYIMNLSPAGAVETLSQNKTKKKTHIFWNFSLTAIYMSYDSEYIELTITEPLQNSSGVLRF